MSWALDPISLQGNRVSIRNYTPNDFEKIAETIHDPQGWFGTQWNRNTPELIVKMLESNLAAHQAGKGNPLSYWVGDCAAGVTQLMRIEAANKMLEIGGTWVAPRWRKTFVNTEVKLLLLQYCFEELHAERVELRVDSRNIVSQQAVLRIGASLEGRLRNRQVFPDGKVSDGFLFSVVRPEWNQVKERLILMNQGLRQRGDRSCPHPMS
jgi:RimJ/RimL family protein N-acetyltransferase